MMPQIWMSLTNHRCLMVTFRITATMTRLHCNFYGKNVVKLQVGWYSNLIRVQFKKFIVTQSHWNSWTYLIKLFLHYRTAHQGSKGFGLIFSLDGSTLDNSGAVLPPPQSKFLINENPGDRETWSATKFLHFSSKCQNWDPSFPVFAWFEKIKKQK